VDPSTLLSSRSLVFPHNGNIQRLVSEQLASTPNEGVLQIIDLGEECPERDVFLELAMSGASFPDLESPLPSLNVPPNNLGTRLNLVEHHVAKEVEKGWCLKYTIDINLLSSLHGLAVVSPTHWVTKSYDPEGRVVVDHTPINDLIPKELYIEKFGAINSPTISSILWSILMVEQHNTAGCMISLNDVSKAFQRIKVRPDHAARLAYLVGDSIIIPSRLTFGSILAPFAWGVVTRVLCWCWENFTPHNWSEVGWTPPDDIQLRSPFVESWKNCHTSNSNDWEAAALEISDLNLKDIFSSSLKDFPSTFDVWETHFAIMETMFPSVTIDEHKTPAFLWVYVDDLIGVFPSQHSQHLHEGVGKLMIYLLGNESLNPDKRTPPSSITQVLGWVIDIPNKKIWPSPNKIKKLTTLLYPQEDSFDWFEGNPSREMCQSLVGVCHHLTGPLFHMKHSFKNLQDISHIMERSHSFNRLHQVGRKKQKEISTWRSLLEEEWSKDDPLSRSLHISSTWTLPETEVVIFTDASLSGGGGVVCSLSPHHSDLHFYHLTFDDEVISRLLSFTEKSNPRDAGLINQLELIVVILIFDSLPTHLRSLKITCFVDNSATVGWLKGKLISSSFSFLSHVWLNIALTCKFPSRFIWSPTSLNVIADKISRINFSEFQSFALSQEAHPNTLHLDLALIQSWVNSSPPW